MLPGCSITFILIRAKLVPELPDPQLASREKE